MGPGFGAELGRSLMAAAVLLLLSGIIAGACGGWACSKLAGYRIKIEKVEK